MENKDYQEWAETQLYIANLQRDSARNFKLSVLSIALSGFAILSVILLVIFLLR